MIKYHVGSESMINLSLFDIEGKKVYDLINSRKNAGDYQFEFYHQDLKNGVYILHFISNGIISNTKLILS
jgi:hypothetical protein